MVAPTIDPVRALDVILCLVDGSDESFGSLKQTRALAPSSARIVAVIPFDLQGAARARCQAGEVASAWDAQAKLIRARAAATLDGSWGYTRIVEGNRLSALLKAAHEEGGTTIAVPAAALRRGDLRKLLRRTDGSVLVSRAEPLRATAAVLLLDEDDLSDVAAGLSERLGARIHTIDGPRPAAARTAVAESRPGDLVVVRGAARPRRWSDSPEQAVARRAAASVLIVRPSASGGAVGAEPAPGVEAAHSLAVSAATKE